MSGLNWRNVGSLNGVGSLILAMFLLAAAGCTEVDTRLDRNDLRQSGKAGWSRLELPDVDRQRAFAAGVHAVSEWFAIDEADAEEGRIRSRYEEYSQQGHGGRIRDAAAGDGGFHYNLRRSATLLIETQDGRSVAFCRVDRERDDTAEQRLFYYQMQAQEQPTQTPIDMDASVPGEQRRSWTSLSRDRGLERQILDALQERLKQSGGG